MGSLLAYALQVHFVCLCPVLTLTSASFVHRYAVLLSCFSFFTLFHPLFVTEEFTDAPGLEHQTAL